MARSRPPPRRWLAQAFRWQSSPSAPPTTSPSPSAWTGPTNRIAAGWHTARPRPFDLGLLRGDGVNRRFIEGVGGGLVEACMRAFEQRPVPADEPPPWQIVRALRRYSEALARLEPRPWDFLVDGTRRTGDFLLVEVLNGRAVGPNLELAPDANPFDGCLAVVAARAEDREVLACYLADLLGGRDSRLQLPVEPARHVEIVTRHPLHVDDAVIDAWTTGSVSIDVEPGALTVLTHA